MGENTFGRKKAAASDFSQPSLVSPTTPTLANPVRGFGLPTNEVIQKATEVLTDTQEISSQQQVIQEKPVGHDINRISFHRPQAKLTVGEPGDKYEQEADMMAHQVMSISDTAIQHQMSSLAQREPILEEEEIQTQPLIASVQADTSQEEEELQTKPKLQRASHVSLEAGDGIENRLNSSKGGGSPLADEVRRFMEPRFGADFSKVRVHTNSEAVQMNQELGAQAFTYGNDIYYGGGKSPAKDALTAHELTHVVQQSNISQSGLNKQVTQALVNSQPERKTLVQNQAKTPEIQKDPVAAASLGVAIFVEGRSIASSGNLYHTANTPSYMHERTPSDATWERVRTTLKIQAHHPRLGWGDQDFYYRLSYERNGYDIRNAQVDVLRDQSSGMYTSVFGSNWSGQTHSRPTAAVAEIVFNISGEWNPHGLGHVSWWGNLILSAAKGGAPYTSFSIGSERDWVWAAS